MFQDFVKIQTFYLISIVDINGNEQSFSGNFREVIYNRDGKSNYGYEKERSVSMKKSMRWIAAMAFLGCFALSALAANPVVDLVQGGEEAPASADTAVSAAGTADVKAQEAASPFEPSASNLETNTKRLAEIEKSLAEWKSISVDAAAARFGITVEEANSRIEVLTALKNTYPRINENISRLVKQKAELEKQRLDNSAPQLAMTDKPPYTMNFYNSYLGALDDIRKQSEDAKDNVTRRAGIAEASQKAVKEKEAAWRLARDNETKEKTPQTSWNVQSAALDVENARAQLILDNCEKERADILVVTYDLQFQRRDQLKNYILENVDLSEASFKSQIEAMDAEVSKLENSKPAVIRQLKAAEQAVDTAEQKYAASKNDEEKELNANERSYRITARNRYRSQLDYLQETLVLMAQRKRVWTLRYDLRRSAVDKTSLPDIVKKLAAQVATNDNELLGLQKELLSLQSKQSSIEKIIEDEKTNKQSLALLKNHRTVIQEAIDNCLDFSAAVISTAAQQRHFILELQKMYDSVSITDKTAALWKKKADELLNTELWQSGGYGVRLKEFALALAIIVFGIWVGKHVVHLFSRLTARHFKIDETSRRTLDRFVFYLLIIIIFLTALRIVNIPLTAFAFLGGAVAIAIGFGAQNMFNNLISGIILTLNRPFRLGDTIEVGSICGTVMDLGVRSTLIRTFDEREVIVPNSQLLDNQMVNWSLSDALLRGSVNFSACYGTPVKLVKETALKVVAANPKILTTPAPWVLFANFGDSSLEFTLYFWVNQKIISATKAGGELREAIQAAFDEAGIEMAFPQMDIHFVKDHPMRKRRPAASQETEEGRSHTV